MHKSVDFGTYKKIRSLSLNDFNRWCGQFYVNAFEDGVSAERADWENRSAQTPEVVAEMTEDDLLECIKSVSGVGAKRADKIMEAIRQRGIVI